MLSLTGSAWACSSKKTEAAAPAGSDTPAAGSNVPAVAVSVRNAPLSNMKVDHGELDTKAPDNSPKLAATEVATIVYKRPSTEAKRLGYIRLGGIVSRDAEPVKGGGCKKKWYRIYPTGFVCTEQATTDMDSALVKATRRRANINKPMPYHYGFVRATAPQYLVIPSKKDQVKSEFKLLEHIDWFHEHYDEVQKVVRGANDVPLDARGVAVPGLEHPPGFRESTQLARLALFGGDPEKPDAPFWLDGGRQIPNVSTFKVPDYAIFADRVRRKTGLSFVDAFDTEDDGLKRSFAVTVDLRLIPTTKVKPDTGSPYHGVELKGQFDMPFAIVIKRDSKTYKLIRGKDEARPAGKVPRRAIVPLSGRARIKDGKRFYQTKKMKTRWLRASDVGVVTPPQEWPDAADKGDKWIDVSLAQQTLVLYEGKKAWYATLVSTGQDRFGDPKKSKATPMGTFRLESKHIAAAMDSEENSSVAGGKKSRSGPKFGPKARATIKRLKEAEKAGKKLDDMDRRRLLNIKKGRHPEYGVTMRRGSGNYELRDVPWIQYFAAGYALHGAYWHDVFGIPRSHGCINLAPIDARVVFNWTDPPVPDGWHGINIGDEMGKGTVVHVRK